MKKLFYTALSIALLITLIPIQPVFAENRKNNTSDENTFTEGSIEQLKYETGIDSPFKGQYLTYAVDENDNIVRIENTSTKSLTTIVVFVGGVLLGYLSSTVVEGIVISVTGQSGGWWVSQAIIQVLNKRYTSTTTINCDVYPPNSYEGAMCRAA